ncbi:Disulfide bond formation protein DsbB [Tranquillimonas rosea]|uniref:Disulfide bond formation protein DsbB n=1 Tax=Tranquillimonas rosea TaxID=641238 RepID=A0A1H9VJM7_9RHOB|nr:disulfide bond formation protein B [Tranquillimonas rosea]SES21759.1 Disulfide bond formation protein DsbB [Tranquillimonas rosea]
MTAKRLIQLAALGSALLLGGAFVFQALGYPPCKLCLWQRWPHAAAILLGLVGTFVPARWVAGLGGLAAATTSLFGVYHTGVERGWWEGPTSCTGDGGGLSGMSGADLLSTEGASGVIMCDEVAWAFAGLSMASWNAILSALLVMVWVLALRRASR